MFLSSLKSWEYWHKDCWYNFDFHESFVNHTTIHVNKLLKEVEEVALEQQRHGLRCQIKKLEMNLYLLEQQFEEVDPLQLQQFEMIIQMHSLQVDFLLEQKRIKTVGLWALKQELDQLIQQDQTRMELYFQKYIADYQQQGNEIMMKKFNESKQIMQQHSGESAYGFCGCGKRLKNNNASHRHSKLHDDKLRLVCMYFGHLDDIIILLMKVIPNKDRQFYLDKIIPFLFEPFSWKEWELAMALYR